MEHQTRLARHYLRGGDPQERRRRLLRERVRPRSPVRPLGWWPPYRPSKKRPQPGKPAPKSRVAYAGLGADWQESARPDNSPAMSQFRAIVFALRHNFRLHLFLDYWDRRARIMSTLADRVI